MKSESQSEIKFNNAIYLFPLPLQRNSIEWKIHLFVTLFKGIKAFSCLFCKKRGNRIVTALWGCFCFPKDKMGADKKLTEMLSSCPDQVNLRLEEHWRESCFCCLSGCAAAKDTWAFYGCFVVVVVFLLLFHFLPSFPSLPLLFLVFFISLSLFFSFPPHPLSQKESKGDGCCKQGRDRTWKRDDPAKQSSRAVARMQMMAHTACFSHHWGAKWWCGDVTGGITKYIPEMGLLLSIHLSSHHLKDYGPREETETGNNMFSLFFSVS